MTSVTENDKRQKRGLVKIVNSECTDVVDVDNYGNLQTSISAQDSASIDGFARMRVSNPQTLFDSKQIFDNQPLFWDDQEVSGSGTSSTHSVNAARTRISVGASTAGKRVRQTFMRFNYQPGKSQLVILTGVLGVGESGITQEVGLFDDDNGLLFRCEDDVLSVVIKSNVSGSAVDTEVVQSNWNIDKLDGTGESGFSLDLTKTQIFFFDFEWLGVGRVRCGFFIAGVPVYCHQFLNANTFDTVYMSSPNLPIRYSIENDGTGGASDLDHICSTVISEGGSQNLGVIRYASTNGTHVDADTENTIYAVIGIRLKSTNLDATINILTAAISIVTGSDKIEWIFKLNPTVAGTFTYSDETNSSVQIARGATANTVTGGTDITGGFLESGGIQAGSAGSTEVGIDSAIYLGADIAGVVDEMVLCARPIAGSINVDVEGSLTWRELS